MAPCAASVIELRVRVRESVQVGPRRARRAHSALRRPGCSMDTHCSVVRRSPATLWPGRHSAWLLYRGDGFVSRRHDLYKRGGLPLARKSDMSLTSAHVNTSEGGRVAGLFKRIRIRETAHVIDMVHFEVDVQIWRVV